MGIFIPHDKLKNLKAYKYSSEDHSIVSRYILKKWWNGFVKVFPLSMAPNVITLLGLCFIVANLACVIYYDPNFDTEQPRWCYFFYAFGLFMYQTFDGCDGCHARRTGQSGPLGELFDHSIDALNTTLGAMIFASVMKMGHGYMLLISQFATCCNFYASTWEEYHTHTLYLSEFSGPVEGVLMVCAVYIVTGIFGPGIWDKTLFSVDLSLIGLAKHFRINTSLIYVVLGVPSLVFNIKAAMLNVYKSYKARSSEKPGVDEVAVTKSRHAYAGLLPFFGYYVLIGIYIFMYPEVLRDHTYSLILSIGLTVAFTVGRIILAHLTIQSFPMIQPPMFVPIAQIALNKLLINVYGYNRAEIILAVSWLGFGLVLGIHSVFVSDMIYEITTFLDINTLSIKHKKA